MKKRIIYFGCMLISTGVWAQDEPSMLAVLEDSAKSREPVTGAFKSSRVIQAHSIEMLHKGNLDFRILHRFGPLNQGAKEFFGLDQASMRMGFDYGLSNNLTIGVGRSTWRKEYDGFIKYRILQQSRGQKSVPFSLAGILGAMIRTAPETTLSGYKPTAADRTSYYFQLLIGRKFSEIFSLQLSPLVMHQQFVEDPRSANTLFAMGGGARLKITRRMAIMLDYHHVTGGLPAERYNPLGLGVDIETGGHVFQLHFSNAVGMNERAFLADNSEAFFKGDIRFGFNLSRIFKLGKDKKSSY